MDTSQSLRRTLPWLIAIIVVVLGASVAWSQWQQKRASSCLAHRENVQSVEEQYHAAKGGYTASFADLDHFSGTQNEGWVGCDGDPVTLRSRSDGGVDIVCPHHGTTTVSGPNQAAASTGDGPDLDLPTWASRLKTAEQQLGKSKDAVVAALGAPQGTYGGTYDSGRPVMYLYSVAGDPDPKINPFGEHIGTEFSADNLVVRAEARFGPNGDLMNRQTVPLTYCDEVWGYVAGQNTKPTTLYYDLSNLPFDHPDWVNAVQDDKPQKGGTMHFTLSGKDAEGNAVLVRGETTTMPVIQQQHFNTTTNHNDVTGYTPNPAFDWHRALATEIDIYSTWSPPDTDAYHDIDHHHVTASSSHIDL